MTVILIGTVLVLSALLMVVFLVIAPPAPRVSRARRLQPGEEYIGVVTRATNATVGAIESTMKGGRGLFTEAELELAGVRMVPSAFVLVTGAIGAVLALVGVVAGFSNPVLAIILALAFAALAPLVAKVYLRLRIARRRARFADQLDDTLQLLAGNLRAGYGLVQGLDALARDAEEPTSEEFARLVNETRIGRDLGMAMLDTAARMRSDDFTWAAQAIQVNRETGGNLAEVLLQIAATIRDRNQIRRQVSALSAEGRMSAILLVALPIAVFVVVLIVQPSYVAFFTQTIPGVICLAVAAVLMVLGSIWMFATTRVKF